MEKEKNKKVIAYRVRLGYSSLIVCFAILIALAILVTVALAFVSWLAMAIAIIVDIGFCIQVCKYIFLSAHLPAERYEGALLFCLSL